MPMDAREFFWWFEYVKYKELNAAGVSLQYIKKEDFADFHNYYAKVFLPKLDKSKIEKQTAQKLSEIFTDPNDYPNALKALQTLAITDKQHTFLLSQRAGKCAIVAWIDVLKYRGKIKTTTNKELVTLLNAQFKNLPQV